MIGKDADRARTPGPVGIIPGTANGRSSRLPGPLGFRTVVFMAPTAVTKISKITTIMPPPANDDKTKDVRVVPWPLFSNAKSAPVFNEVKQASSLANCPVAAILAALAFTAAGRSIIQNMVAENAGNVVTDISGLPKDTLTNPPKSTSISSSRYFTVKLPGGSVDVSDVLYTDDADSGWSLIYMQDPKDQSLWAAIIEKALAVQLGSYENFDALNINANDFWQKITGARPGAIEIKSDTSLKTITEAAKASATVPSIGASRDTDVKFVTQFHGFAMMGLEGAKIKLYDPAKVKTILISPADFRHDFQMILFRN